MKTTHNGKAFETLVVRPILNGYLIEMETEIETITVHAASWRQVVKFIKIAENGMSTPEAHGIDSADIDEEATLTTTDK